MRAPAASASLSNSPRSLNPPKNPRLLHIDALRGILLVMMAVNHIPSDLQIATNHIFGFVSAAEGFVFLSGLMAGLVYARRYYRDGATEMKESAVKRASGIYVFHSATYILVLLGLQVYLRWLGEAPAIAPRPMVEQPWSALLGGLLLLQQPSLFDILPMYCGLLLVVPFLVVACSRGERKAILVGSFLLWGLVNLLSPQTPFERGILNTGSFNILAWQLLFVVGVVFGHAWATKERLWPRPHAGLIALALVVASVLYALRHTLLQIPGLNPWLEVVTNKNNLAPLRLLNTALLTYLVYTVAVHFPRVLNWRAFAFLGQHSMFVFAVHIVIAYLLQAFPGVFGLSSAGRWLATFLMIATLFAAAAFHRAWQERTKSQTSKVHARQAWLPDPKLGHES